MNSFRNTNNGTVKHIIIINVIFFVLFCASFAPLRQFFPALALWYVDAPYFQPWQLITHFFMHGSFTHILFNMYALYIFGTVLEQVWGSRKFIFFYFATGIGASVLYSIIAGIEYYIKYGTFFPVSESLAYPNIYVPMVGASGAIFGLLTAFGTLFPNTELRLLFPPIALKAKYFVLIYIAIELWLGVQQFSGDNVAHFAHITGALMGYLIVKYWQKNSNSFY